MKKIIAFTLLILSGCSRTNQQSESTSINSVTPPSTTFQDDYAAAEIYSSYDSDSLLLNDGVLNDLINTFISKGILIQEKNYGAGDCFGKFKRFKKDLDTLTINKHACGEYGFENDEFLKQNDSLIIVRRYKMEYVAGGNGFNLTEQIFEFHGSNLTLNERNKKINGWKNFNLTGIPFKTTYLPGENDYKNLRKELEGILNYELYKP